jgi:hypothetical protein
VFTADDLVTLSSVAEFNASTKLTLALTPGVPDTTPNVSVAAFAFTINSLGSVNCCRRCECDHAFAITEFDNTSSTLGQILLDVIAEFATLISSAVESAVPPIVVADAAALLATHPLVVNVTLRNVIDAV